MENINKYFYHAREGDKGFMDKATKEIEKFSINILRHYKELRSFIDGINDNNIFCISNADIECTKRLVSKLEKAMSKLNPIQKKLI